MVRLEGRDVLALLHRISTQFLSDLEPGQARMTLFCDFRGRLLHRVAVACVGHGVVWLLRDDTPAAEVAALVGRHVFREEVRDAGSGDRWTVRAVFRDLGLPPGTVRGRHRVPEAVQIAPDFGYLISSGPPPPLDPEDERRRIEAGRPRHRHEISEEFNPFEVGLAHEVHLGKGCYTGQEALARMVTYGGVRRALARLEGPGPVPSTPCALRAGGEDVGRLTSAIPDAGGWIGLAVIRQEAMDASVTLTLEGAGPVGRPHPFPPTRPLGIE